MLFRDIEILESAIISFTEGASDEKRMSISSLEGLIAEKKAIIKSFEDTYNKELDLQRTRQVAPNQYVDYQVPI